MTKPRYQAVTAGGGTLGAPTTDLAMVVGHIRAAAERGYPTFVKTKAALGTERAEFRRDADGTWRTPGVVPRGWPEQIRNILNHTEGA